MKRLRKSNTRPVPELKARGRACLFDGRLEEFTRKAMANYRQAKSLPADWIPETSNIARHTVYRITSRDLSFFGANAEEPGEQAKQSKRHYTTPIKVLSERFHTTQKYLRALDAGIDINSAPPGTSITVPAVPRPFDYHAYPSSYRPPSSATAKARHVSVGLRERILSIHENGRLIATFPIIYTLVGTGTAVTIR